MTGITRGFIKHNLIMPSIRGAEQLFKNTINSYPDSSWIVEAGIKLDFH